jgi:hypothetical protein
MQRARSNEGSFWLPGTKLPEQYCRALLVRQIAAAAEAEERGRSFRITHLILGCLSLGAATLPQSHQASTARLRGFRYRSLCTFRSDFGRLFFGYRRTFFSVTLLHLLLPWMIACLQSVRHLSGIPYLSCFPLRRTRTAHSTCRNSPMMLLEVCRCCPS